MDNNLKSIGKNIQKYRVARGLTQRELANRTYISKRQIGEIETGKSFSNIDVLCKISDLLDIPIDLLFADCDKEFLVYAIDDYLNLINKKNAALLMDEIITLMGQKNEV